MEKSKNTVKPIVVGTYLAFFAYSLEHILTASWRWYGKLWWLTLPTYLITIIISYVAIDALFRRWNTTRKKRLIVAALVLILVIVLGIIASMLNLYYAKLELSKLYL